MESISESLNGTTVECEDAMMNTVGSVDICIVGKKVQCTYICVYMSNLVPVGVYDLQCTCNSCLIVFTVYGICTA